MVVHAVHNGFLIIDFGRNKACAVLEPHPQHDTDLAVTKLREVLPQLRQGLRLPGAWPGRENNLGHVLLVPVLILRQLQQPLLAVLVQRGRDAPLQPAILPLPVCTAAIEEGVSVSGETLLYCVSAHFLDDGVKGHRSLLLRRKLCDELLLRKLCGEPLDLACLVRSRGIGLDALALQELLVAAAQRLLCPEIAQHIDLRPHEDSLETAVLLSRRSVGVCSHCTLWQESTHCAVPLLDVMHFSYDPHW